jgi:uncharacterized caspase-like protein
VEGLVRKLFLLLFALLLAVPASAEPRLALVIGNGAYGGHVGALANPTGDARAVAAALQRDGFDVDLRTDLDQKGMRRAVRRLGERLRAAGPGATGLFYYGGHGMAAAGENYLIPTDANIAAESDVAVEGVPASGVLTQMQGAGGSVNIVILDACRNTPALGTRGGARGLARMDAPNGAFVVYSTAPGAVAEDGTSGSHSPFATALVAELAVPGEALERVFKQVSSRVQTATHKRQVPWTSSSLVADFYFVAPSVATPAPVRPVAPAFDERQAEVAFWKSVADSGDVAQLQNYTPLKSEPENLPV